MPEDIPPRWNRPIFIASMGRSGSTLLQRVLNVHPGITIWGEHGGFLSGVLRSYVSASQPETANNLEIGFESRGDVIGELGDKKAFKPWVSPFTTTDLEDEMREMVRGLFTRGLDPSIRWGFKEIRYSREELSTLMKMFPTASLIILARDFRGFAQSRFFAFGNTNYDFQSPEGRAAAQERLSTMSGAWIRRYQELLTVADAHPTRASLVAYSDLVPASPRFDSLFEELRDTPPDPAAIEAVLGAKSGSSFKFNAEARENSETLLELIDGAAIDWDEERRLADRLGL